MDQPKLALVTGSGRRRVGNVVASTLARHGYGVALHYRSSEAEALQSVVRLKEQGVRTGVFQADLARESDVHRLFDEVLRQFGRLDLLVNTAAVWDPVPLEQTTADEVRRQMDINTLGTFLCCQRGGLIMADQKEGGAIVNIGDWAVARPYHGYAAYFASKGPIETITRTMAIELAQRNPSVRVNCILPGPVMLPPDLPEDERREAIEGTLVKREGRPEHVAHAVLFLAENAFVTGVSLPVDGGRTIAAQ